MAGSAIVTRSLLSMSVLLCVLATAAAKPTEDAIGEAYASLVNVTGNQEFWAERAEVSEPVAVMDRFDNGARGAPAQSLARKLRAGAGGAAAAGPCKPSASAAMPPAGSPAVSTW
jgi:pectate lyase